MQRFYRGSSSESASLTLGWTPFQANPPENQEFQVALQAENAQLQADGLAMQQQVVQARVQLVPSVLFTSALLVCGYFRVYRPRQRGAGAKAAAVLGGATSLLKRLVLLPWAWEAGGGGSTTAGWPTRCGVATWHRQGRLGVLVAASRAGAAACSSCGHRWLGRPWRCWVIVFGRSELGRVATRWRLRLG